MASIRPWRRLAAALIVVVIVGLLAAATSWHVYRLDTLVFQPVGSIPEQEAVMGRFETMLLGAVLMFTTMAAFIVVPAALLLSIAVVPFLILKMRGFCLLLTFLSIASVFAEVAGAFLVEQYYYHETFEHAFSDVANRSQPLIDAIESYKRANGIYPPDLQHLLPQFLKEVPNTGLAGYPTYEYGLAEPQAVADMGPYEIRINILPGGLRWDFFVYWPSGKYPEHLYGGSPEFFGKWAYVHD